MSVANGAPSWPGTQLCRGKDGPGLRCTAKGRGTAAGTTGRAWPPFLPTISGINISPVPQVLGQFRPMWYLAGTSFDRHT